MSSADEQADALVYGDSLEEGLAYAHGVAALKNRKKKPIKICKLCQIDEHCNYCSCCR